MTAPRATPAPTVVVDRAAPGEGDTLDLRGMRPPAAEPVAALVCLLCGPGLPKHPHHRDDLAAWKAEGAVYGSWRNRAHR